MSKIRKEYESHIFRKIIFLIVLAVLVVIVSVISLNVGSSDMTIKESILAIFGQSSERYQHIIFNIRLPRIIGGFFVGMSIALSGMIIQTTLNNPLASPSTIGISSASTLGANIVIILFARLNWEISALITSGFSFITAMLCMILVLAISSLKGSDKTTVILAGVAFNSLFGACITLLQYFSDDTRLASAVAWTFGDLSKFSYNEIYIVMAVTIVSATIIFLLRWRFNAMDMGENTAHSLGVNTRRIRNLSIVIAAVNTGVSVAFVGMIGFVGLLAPQVTKRIIGEDKRYMLPGTLLMGAFTVLVSDTIARTIVSPIVLPVGAITSLLGAPLFIYILINEK